MRLRPQLFHFFYSGHGWSVEASIGVAFYAFIIFTSNPFLRLADPPFNGRDLNPLLQDPGLAFHPPFLYLGYVGLSMAFSFAIIRDMEPTVVHRSPHGIREAWAHHERSPLGVV
mgnify:CR=1 FL=1